MVAGSAVSRAAGASLGPKTGAGCPYSKAPRSGRAPTNCPSLMFGKTAPASTALQVERNVITCGGTVDGGGFGTLIVSKQLSWATRMPCVSRPDPAANEERSGYVTKPYVNGMVLVPQSNPS